MLFKNKELFDNTNDKLNNYQITKIKKNIFKSDYPIFVNFYTGDNGYEKVVPNLIDSLNKFNLPYYIVEINSNGDKWEKICQQKPYVLLHVMNKYPIKNVVWVDADAVIEKLPKEFLKIKKDIGTCYIGKNLASGTIFFKNNKICKKIINDWINENNKSNKTWDQVTLDKVLNKTYKNHIHTLPNSYIGIFNKNAVISQWQFSRNVKPKNSYQFEGVKNGSSGTPISRYGINFNNKIEKFESSIIQNPSVPTRKILLTQLYNPKDSFRLKEILDCLKINVNNDNIDEIHLFVENKNDFQLINNIDKKKIKFVLNNNRLKYKSVFDYTNNLNKSDIYILSNSDIYFDNTLKNLDNLNFNKLFLSLTRINETVNKKKNFKHQPNSGGSQDVWVWKGNLNIYDDKLYNNDGITMGIGGCDLKLNYIIEKSGYTLKNYCKLVNCFHKHFYGDLIHNNKNENVYTKPLGRIKCEDLN